MKRENTTKRLIVRQRRAVRALPRVASADEPRPYYHHMTIMLDGNGLSPVGITTETEIVICLTAKHAPGELGAIEREDRLISVGFFHTDGARVRVDWPGGERGHYCPGARIIGAVVAIVGERDETADEWANFDLVDG